MYVQSMGVCTYARTHTGTCSMTIWMTSSGRKLDVCTEHGCMYICTHRGTCSMTIWMTSSGRKLDVCTDIHIYNESAYIYTQYAHTHIYTKYIRTYTGQGSRRALANHVHTYIHMYIHTYIYLREAGKIVWNRASVSMLVHHIHIIQDIHTYDT
jgi:hypothetical protein